MDFEFSDESSDESDSEDDENWNENGGNENNEAIAKRDRICASLQQDIKIYQLKQILFS